MGRMTQISLIWITLVALTTLEVFSEDKREGDPDWVRAIEIREELEGKDSIHSVEENISDVWLEALIYEFGPEHPVLLLALETLGKDLYGQHKYQESLKVLEQKVELSTKILGAEHSETLASVNNLAQLFQAIGNLTRARDLHEKVLDSMSRINGADHRDTLAVKANLASNLFDVGNLEEARILEEEVLTSLTHILGEEHPDTLTVKGNLAITLSTLGNLEEARQLHEAVLAGRSRVLGHKHPHTLTTMAGLAETLRDLGRIAEARQLAEEVLDLRIRESGESHPETLGAKATLGTILLHLGDLAGARQHFEEVLAGRQSIFGDEHHLTLSAKANLAVVFHSLGYLNRTREIQEEVLIARSRILGDDHPDTLIIKANLAETLRALDDSIGARRLLEDVLSTQCRLFGEESPATLTTKVNLAVTLLDLGKFSEARRSFEETLVSRQRIFGDKHPATLNSRANLAFALYRLGDLAEAQQQFEELLVAQSELIPDTIEEATSFFHLGITQRDLGLLEEAYASLSLGLDTLEAQTLRADLSENVRSLYKSRFEEVYRETLSIALTRQQPHDAFNTLERFRAQNLISLFRWSRLDEDSRIPAEYRDELTKISRNFDKIIWQLDRIDFSSEKERYRELLVRQSELRRRREEIQGMIIRNQLIDRGLHRPLQFKEVLRHIEPGTLLLTYTVGDDASHLFALDSDGRIEVHPVEAEAKILWRQVARLRNIEVGIGKTSDEARLNLSNWLYEKLLQPVANRIAKSERLVIIPEGPLYYLPFAALTFPAEGLRGWQYLVEYRPIHIVQSATVYAELQNRRRARGANITSARQWIGFGNPSYPIKVGAISDANTQNTPTLKALRSPVERGIWGGLTELPFTAHEINEIAALFPRDKIKIHLAAEATEGNARQIPAGTRIIHFAAHGLADRDHPMDSFLALSLFSNEASGLPSADRHNGLLQAWEIVEHLDLDADLVVLSACSTAFGPNRTGEGLISLSRAFQIAGARSVLASLWAVNDASTAELMIRFYRHLLDEDEPKTKDEALRAAQLELIQGGEIVVETEKGEKERRDFSHPYYWAAFQLIGDWQ